jgi:carboxyl-terminal processing protease
MNLRPVLLGLLLAAPLSLIAAKPVAPPSTTTAAVVVPKASESQAQAAMWATRFLTRFHYKRVPLDDSMSAEILKRYIESLDADKLFFLKSDVDGFDAQFKTTLDDAIYDQALTPPFTMFDRYVQRVGERTQFARSLLAKPFDFTVDERYRFDRKDVEWAAAPADLDKIWRLRIKNDWLRLRLAGKPDAEIKKTLDKRYKSFQDRVDELDGEDIFQTFLNAYAASIEPHTGYLGPRTAENFNIQMRLSLEGIGAVLGKDDEMTIVRQVVKGGPADESGKIKEGDRITGVAQDKGPVQDVIGWRLDDVVDLVRGKKGTTVVLDVLPKDGGVDAKPIHVAIVRDTVKLEEQAAKQQIIDVPVDGRVRKIGVITLPAFYHDFEASRRGDADFRSSTRDVAKLLIELKAAGVEGVVIDLRDNGGGSLTEATNLTGLFIDQGPVVQVRDAQGRVSVEADTEKGVQWDGPLAVLVNRTSASASEIFAAALQDYGRALIIGETTYGKGTVQNLVDLDEMARNETPVFGQLKLTVAQFFRVNGGSTQNRGVVPDVEFPQTIDPKEWGESANENALPWTSITPADYKGRGDFRELLPLLSSRHEARVAKDREYQYWVDDLRDYRKLREQKEVSLLESERKSERDALEAKRKAREAERAALAQTEDDKAAAKAKVENDDKSPLDDGLQADERPIADREDEDDDKPDELLSESAFVLSDAIDLLAGDQKLAARVRGFTIADVPPAARRVN